MLIVGEGRETEYNYFVGFRNAHEETLRAVATSISVKRGRGGSARDIVENAIKERKKFKPDRKRGDRVFLVMDTEGDSNIPGAGRRKELPNAEKLASNNDIEIIYSSPAFEYWLLCHFDKISRGAYADCDALVAALDKKWDSVSKSGYDKADLDVFKRLAHLLDGARPRALDIDLHHIKTHGSARRVNPSTQVYELIAILIGVASGVKCPLSAPWRLVADKNIVSVLNKGAAVPKHENLAAHWLVR